jgi:hypothetical protein
MLAAGGVLSSSLVPNQALAEDLKADAIYHGGPL